MNTNLASSTSEDTFHTAHDNLDLVVHLIDDALSLELRIASQLNSTLFDHAAQVGGRAFNTILIDSHGVFLIVITAILWHLLANEG